MIKQNESLKEMFDAKLESESLNTDDIWPVWHQNVITISQQLWNGLFLISMLYMFRIHWLY